MSLNIVSRAGLAFAKTNIVWISNQAANTACTNTTIDWGGHLESMRDQRQKMREWNERTSGVLSLGVTRAIW
jgi:hypothetical protein